MGTWTAARRIPKQYTYYVEEKEGQTQWKENLERAVRSPPSEVCKEP